VRETLLLSVDFEDWHQLVRRRVGVADWERAGPALRGQTRALLDLLDELGVRATFFVLGMAARAHPELVEAVAERGHEIGSHGDAHRPVHGQTPAEFGADLRAARETIERVSGQRPVGYRAPAFSITREDPWAYEVLADEGFAYDASQHDSPRIRGRVREQAGAGPHRIPLDGGRELWEFPVAVWQGRLPVGGASYWAVTPRTLTLAGLSHAGRFAGLYLHPHELDPHPLRVGLDEGAPTAQRLHAAVRAAQRNAARWRAPDVLRAIAERFPLIPYGEAYAELDGRAPART
jgi:polysaccharide deacetylase family protein (PEP-CTERM system associated)